MDFSIKKLITNTVSELTGSFPNTVTQVEFEFKEVNGSLSSSVDFVGGLLFPNSSSFSSYSDLTENQVTNWITSSFETVSTYYTAKKQSGEMVMFPTGSWSNFESAVKSHLQSEISKSMELQKDNGLPW